MKLTKPSASLITEFRWVASQLPHAQLRKMFGYDALFVNGNMAAGLWQNTCVVKVSAADQAALLARGAAIPFAPMKDRVMTGWLELSEAVAHDPEELLTWAGRAVAHTATLPAKARGGAKGSSLSPSKKKSPKKVAPETTRRQSKPAKRKPH